MRKRRVAAYLFVLLPFAGMLALSPAQEGVDKGDPSKRGAVDVAGMTLRVRVVKVVPEQKKIVVGWRRGGQGLGGLVISGSFSGADKAAEIDVGAWSAPLPLTEVVGKGGWVFPNLLIAPADGKKGKKQSLTDTVVEFEFSEKGKVFKTFTETAPKGCTVSFAFPGVAPNREAFDALLQPLSAYVDARRKRIEKGFKDSEPLPKLFALIGHQGGYGEGSGYGIRHCNPTIVADECRVEQLLGFNGLTGKKAVVDADVAGFDFRRMYWGGPGAGSPMNFFKKKADQEVDGCPFDPALKKSMAARVQEAIAEHKAVGAKESWALWWDEMGVAVKEHMQTCPRCREEFEAYLRGHGVQPADVGQASWDRVAPYELWKAGKDKKGKASVSLAAAPKDPAEALRYYYTFRFMTHATGKLFPESAQELKKAGISLYAMQGPTPSWTGASLDWHEFYHTGANTAIVWETSNRDPRVWQLESYLADIVRGIAHRLRLLIGVLVKPHRGAPEQRMLTAVARGARAIEWYTYGPDYARGDSFSQRPDLLDRVAKADRFLGKAEDRLYEARWAGTPEVAFVSPRSSEIWGKATDLDVTAFEDAKWVYLALLHAHIPVDILSEQRLAEGKLDQYKVLYIIGPNLRRDAAAKVQDWVKAGGTLWTDALGLSRDEANQPATALAEMLPLGERKLETWGSVPGYRAVGLAPLHEPAVPAHAALSWEAGGAWGKGKARAGVGREVLATKDGLVLARFADDKPAVIRRAFGKGEVVVVGLWAGLTYSAKVRRPDFDMRADFDAALRALIAAPALERKVYRPVVPSEALVEAVFLEKDGHRSVALMNWSFHHDADKAGRRPSGLQVAENLRVRLRGVGALKAVRSLVHGNLAIEGEGGERSVVVPRLEEIDLLMLE